MNSKLLLLAIFACLIQCCASLPVENVSIAYNLHHNLSAHDINQLGKDQRIKALLDVQTTIDEVEKLLIEDPTLPRLTKGEIRDLFEKVTNDELKKSITSGDKEKQEFMQNLILALPYHSEEFSKIDNLASSKATTMYPIIEPKIPDELKALLKNHGLLNNDQNIGLQPLPILSINNYPLQETGDSNYAMTSKRGPENKPESFTSFKNITLDKKNFTSDIGHFLTQFGLLNNETNNQNFKINKQKKLNSSETKSSYLLPEYSSVLVEMGLQNPKFEALTFSKQYGPDPVKESSKNSNPLKNEFKRQESNDRPTKVSFGLNDTPLLESSLESTDDINSTSTLRPSINIVKTTTEISKISSTSTSVEISSTTEEVKKNNLEDEIDAIDEPAQLPAPRRSGFYMILDWNTFLEVGEDPEKIVVRFDPKIGDPSRFLPVNIP